MIDNVLWHGDVADPEVFQCSSEFISVSEDFFSFSYYHFCILLITLPSFTVSYIKFCILLNIIPLSFFLGCGQKDRVFEVL